MNPLLETKLDYAQKLLGMGKGGTAKLYSDRIEVIDRAGKLIATIKLQEITAVAHPSGMLRIKVGDQLHVLQFFRMPYRLFGLAGLLVSGAGKAGGAWAKQLEQLGVSVSKKLF